MIEDLIQSRYILLISLLFAMIILLIYMFLLRYLASWIIWLSLILCIIVFTLAASFCFLARNRIKNSLNNNNNNTLSNLDEINITFNANGWDNDIITSTDLINKKSIRFEKFDTTMVLLESFAPMSTVWLILGIICCVICSILMICICCLWKRIALAAGMKYKFIRQSFKVIYLALIEEASKAICYALTTLIWPIITFILNISFVILGILVLAHYSTLVFKKLIFFICKYIIY